jgi:hypothetical protein
MTMVADSDRSIFAPTDQGFLKSRARAYYYEQRYDRAIVDYTEA